ncbi:MAG: serine/threonine-protein kinase [Myxococcota bacterium]
MASDDPDSSAGKAQRRNGRAEPGLEPTVRRALDDVKTVPVQRATPATALEPLLQRDAGPLPTGRSQEPGTDPEHESLEPGPGIEPTVRRALHELGTDPGHHPDSPLEPTVRRPLSDVGVPAPQGDFGVEPTSVRTVSSPFDPLIGATLGEYRVLERLGSGGMGHVYRGEQPLLGRPVAIKVLKRELSQDPSHARRLLDEARSVAAARHPNIIDVFSFGETPSGEPYLVMELLDGEPLDVMLARAGALEPRDALALLIPIASALAAAHAVGVIHRDLKPGNVFVARLHDGAALPKLLDFGLARRGEAGARVRQTSVGGTPLYVAPEQMRGEAVGPQADLYSFGCLAFELLAGRPPFTARELATLLDQHQSMAPPPLLRFAPEAPRELERLVARLLEKDPARRPASARDVRGELERIQAELAAAVPETVKLPPTEQPPANTLPAPHPVHVPSRSRVPWAIAGVGLAIIAGLGLWQPWARPTEPGSTFDSPRPATAPPAPTAPPTPTTVLPERAPATDVPPPLPVDPPSAVTQPLESSPASPGPRSPKAAPKSPAVAKVTPLRDRPSRRDVKRRWHELRQKSRALADDVRRAALIQLDEAKDCSRSVAHCMNELDVIETTFFAQ